ncbi:TonB-dependent receptor plug domain-containing protein [Flavobacteriaceae bacterium GSB9]|nr:TonB-dependent receptor plug domain-containing protein [Flavobacteriaceae bacterium GSB9]
MQIKIKNFTLLWFLLLVFSLKVASQENNKKLPLVLVFSAIEQQFGYQFNYAKDAVEHIRLVAPSKGFSFKETLNYLRNNTEFNYTVIGDFFVLVSQASSTSFKSQKLQQLQEVIVPGYIVRGINKLNNGSFKIDFSNFSMLPGLIEADVLQSVQAFPGIQSINENVSNINIRGGSHDQNLILWDGIKMYQSGHFFGLISMYNPQITEKVVLVKNGSDVSLTDGISGTIAMKTKDDINTQFKGNIALNFIDANGFADVPISKKSSIQLALRKSISDWVETPAYHKFFRKISEGTEVDNTSNSLRNSNEQFDFYDASFRWIYKITEKDELRVNFINVANELIFYENTNQESRRSSVEQNSIAGAISYARKWNNRLRTKIEIYETDYKLKAINANILDNQRFLQENVVSETSFKFKSYHRFNENLSLLAGYHSVETKVSNLDDVDKPIYRFLVSEVVRTHGLFSQLNYTSRSGLTNLSAGLRFNHIDKFNKQLLEPRFSFNHKFKEHFNIEVLGELKHQNTTQIISFQNDFLGVEKRRWFLANNTDIPILKSRQVSLGLSYSKSGWLLSAEIYHKKVNGITAQSQGFQNQYQFAKASGSYQTNGLDFILRKRIRQFNVWLSYAHMDNNYSFQSLQNRTFPSNYNLNHALTLGTTYMLQNLKISAGFNWFSGKPTTFPVMGNEVVNNSVNFESSNSSYLSDYFKADISMLYRFKIGTHTKADLGASIWNIFDTDNEINNIFRVNSEGTIAKTQETSLGFTPNFVLRVYF